MKQQIFQWFQPVAVWWVASAALRALPEPLPNGSRFYLWLHNFAAIAGANFDKIARGEK